MDELNLNGIRREVTAQEALAPVIAAVESRLRGGSGNASQRLALQHAHKAGYEMLWWLNAADAAGSGIITPR